MGIQFQYGQSDLELAGCDTRVLLAPKVGTAPLTNIEDITTGGIDITKVGVASRFRSVGNHEKKAGVKLSNKPTINKIMSNGQGSPTRNLPSESGKGISYTPQETNLLNLQNAWGFPLSAVSAVSAKGGFTIRIPELPVRLQWRTVLIAQDYFNAKPIYLYWIANQAEVGDRSDQGVLDSNVIETTVSLDFQTDPAVGDPVIFGMCGEGIQDLAAAVADGSLYLPATGITTANLSVTAAAGVNHTKQVVVTDSQGIDRTATATFVSDTPAKATVNSAGLVTGVASGSANVTATWNGFTAVSVVTVT
ncbi:Ig-like domain-containing protein [Mycolicibacterium fluoranthenivorans]|uniref:Uncharacterized protein YjdB n=1 Tax=Mycolicibacterium fluoranthenivorans TaxID=258505 RepID=A0A7X5U5U2_9MYCO|nr:Ig-like domain-containing protein [Mycolicibacterium fluoranthenivorans]NIH98899.1 uncharacterized protein YjdB [Mycolicibacterium fluoranthenivorans]